MNVVLIEPEIPPNTGNIARLCAVTNTRLHLIEPRGFRIDDRQLKRAGMDYWQKLDWKLWKSWIEFERGIATNARLWFIESDGRKRYSEATFAPDDYLVFGRETKGIPESLLKANTARWLRIPMFNKETRSLNLANSVSIVLYEALRQKGFDGELS